MVFYFIGSTELVLPSVGSSIRTSNLKPKLMFSFSWNHFTCKRFALNLVPNLNLNWKFEARYRIGLFGAEAKKQKKWPKLFGFKPLLFRMEITFAFRIRHLAHSHIDLYVHWPNIICVNYVGTGVSDSWSYSKVLFSLTFWFFFIHSASNDQKWAKQQKWPENQFQIGQT